MGLHLYKVRHDDGTEGYVVLDTTNRTKEFFKDVVDVAIEHFMLPIESGLVDASKLDKFTLKNSYHFATIHIDRRDTELTLEQIRELEHVTSASRMGNGIKIVIESSEHLLAVAQKLC